MTTELAPQQTLALDKTLAVIQHELARDPNLKSGNTRRGYLSDLTAFENWRAGRTLTKLLAEEYAAELQEAKRSPNSINRILASIRWWARRMGDLAFEDMSLSRETREEIVVQTARIASIEDVKGKSKPKGREIPAGQLDALMRACAEDQTATGIRDGAIVALMWVTGMRRQELADLTLADWTQTDDNAGEFALRGKGSKHREGYVYNGAFDALQDWLTVRGDDPGRLFLATRRGGHIQPGSKMSGTALAKMLAKRCEQAGINEQTTWHDFRRTFAGDRLEEGTDLVTVSKLLGHVDPKTTAGYDRRGEKTKKRAIQRIHVPYRRRTLDK